MNLTAKIIVGTVAIIYLLMGLSPYLNEWANKHIPEEDEEEFINNIRG